jgi:hypothetical protein
MVFNCSILMISFETGVIVSFEYLKDLIETSEKQYDF